MTIVVVVCSHSRLWALVDWMCPLNNVNKPRECVTTSDLLLIFLVTTR